MEKRPNHNLDHRRGCPRPGRRNGYEPDTFFGLDVEEMSPKAQVVAGLMVSIPVTEADKMLKELAEGGHLEVRVQGGGCSTGSGSRAVRVPNGS